MTPVHRDHDELSIVRAAEGDAGRVDARLAQEQLDACAECRALFADVAAIRASTTAAILRVPRRPRSFRVDPETLERRQMSGWRRVLRELGAPRYDVLRPFAGAVAGVGLAVMVLGSLSIGPSSAAAPIRDLAASPATSAGTSEVYGAPGTAAPAPAATAQGGRSTDYGPTSGGGGPASSPPALVSGSGGPSASPAPVAEAPAAQATGDGYGKVVDSGGPASAPAQSAAISGIPVGLIGGVLLLVGAGVFLLQTAARRAALR